MANEENTPIDPLASFDAGQSATPVEGDESIVNDSTISDIPDTQEAQIEPIVQEGESLFGSSDAKIFSSLGSQEADISDYQDGVKGSRKEAKTKTQLSPEERLIKIHAISKVALGIVILVCLVFVADGFAKSSANGSPLLRLPFFQQGNILCNRINGGFDMSSVFRDEAFLVSTGNQEIGTAYDSGACFSRSELTELYEAREEYLNTSTAAALSDILPKKFSFASFSQSPLFRFIQGQSPDRRADHDEIITDVLKQVENVDAKSNMGLLCQRITFEDKVATVNCLARGRGGTSSRDTVIAFLDAIKSQPSLFIIDHPDTIELRELDDETDFDTESSIDLHVIHSASGFETQIIPNVD